MAENEWTSLDEMRGNMGFDRIPDPAAYERAHFRMMAMSASAASGPARRWTTTPSSSTPALRA